MRCKTKEKITYRKVDIREAPASLTKVHNIWTEVKGNCFAPPFRDFDLMLLPKELIPFTSVEDYLLETKGFRYRFYGTGLVKVDGVELTGKSHLDIPHSGLRDLVRELCQKVISEKKECLIHVMVPTLNSEEPIAIAGRWPLSDDGNHVTGILTVVAPLTEVKALQEELENQQSDN